MRALPAFFLTAQAVLFASPHLLAQPPKGEPRAQPEAAPATQGETPADSEAEAEPAPPADAAAAPEPGTPEAPAKPKVKLPGDDVSDDEPEPPLIPAAMDTRGGHLVLSPGIAWVIPFGKLSSDASQTNAFGAGPGFSLDVGLGVSRSLVLGLWGQLSKLGEGDRCPGCSARSLGGGAFLQYHLVQGVRLDPWMSAGIGYRSTTIDLGANGEASYAGLEFLRLQVGGDWYPMRSLGLGPFFEFDSGMYSKRPASAGDGAVHFQFQAGLRLTVDFPGR